MGSQSEFTQNLDQNTLLLLLQLLLQRLPRGAPVSNSVQSTFLHSLAIALLETFLQILSLWMTKLRLRKASDDLPMLTPLQLLEPGFEPGSDQCL